MNRFTGLFRKRKEELQKKTAGEEVDDFFAINKSNILGRVDIRLLVLFEEVKSAGDLVDMKNDLAETNNWKADPLVVKVEEFYDCVNELKDDKEDTVITGIRHLMEIFADDPENIKSKLPLARQTHIKYFLHQCYSIVQNATLPLKLQLALMAMSQPTKTI